MRENYPTIHAVGRASTREPGLLDFRWGEAKAPRVTLVGKWVCFDTGGLDLKPREGMLEMKRDMGGAAIVLNESIFFRYDCGSYVDPRAGGITTLHQ